MSLQNSPTPPGHQIHAVLFELLDQVRGHTIKLLEGVEASALLWAPAGTANHILWHAGHAVWLQDVLGVQLMTGRCELPEGWPERFGAQCNPVSETKDWPSRQVVLDSLYAQWTRLKQLIPEITDKHLEVHRYSLVGRLIHGLHDEARHHGEMYLLLKLHRTSNR